MTMESSWSILILIIYIYGFKTIYIVCVSGKHMHVLDGNTNPLSQTKPKGNPQLLLFLTRF